GQRPPGLGRAEQGRLSQCRSGPGPGARRDHGRPVAIPAKPADRLQRQPVPRGRRTHRDSAAWHRAGTP
nr:hypothetical protein [Tanacetum cinerariifolium]